MVLVLVYHQEIVFELPALFYTWPIPGLWVSESDLERSREWEGRRWGCLLIPKSQPPPWWKKKLFWPFLLFQWGQVLALREKEVQVPCTCMAWIGSRASNTVLSVGWEIPMYDVIREQIRILVCHVDTSPGGGWRRMDECGRKCF